jgi:glutathione S-transferase
MKLYMHPVSMTSRPVRLFIAENGIDVDEQLVDLMTGEHYQEPFVRVNPNRLVPVLEDGDLRLTESSAILKYLADKIDSPAYPQGPEAARQGQRDDGLVQHQFLSGIRLRLDLPATVPAPQAPERRGAAGDHRLGKERAQNWLKILNDYWLGPDKPYLCGNQITIADYFGVSLLTLGEVIRCDFKAYPNIERWLANMKKLRSWPKVNEALYGYAEAVKNQAFV